MRKMLWVFGVILLAAFAAAAQEVPQVDLGAAYTGLHARDAGTQARANTLNASLLPTSRLFEASPGGAPAGPTRPSGNLYPNMVLGEYVFTYVRIGSTDSTSSENFLVHGFDITYVRWLCPWFGVEGTFGGAWGSNTVAKGVDTRLLYGDGGVRVAYGRDKLYTPWARVAFGGGQVQFTETAAATGTEIFGQYIGTVSTNSSSLSESGFVMEAGLGLNVNFGDHWAIKLVEVNYFLTHFASTNQNNIQAKTGVIFKF